MNVSAFRNALGGGGSRPDQYRATLVFPALVGTSSATDTLLITAASLPQSIVAPTITMYRGREVKTAGERTFPPWTISVLNDTTMDLRAKFERWSDLMNERENNGGSTLPSTYMTDLKVEQLDRNDAVIRTYDIFNAFPLNVGAVGLGYNLVDTVSQFDVEFAISHWEVSPE